VLQRCAVTRDLLHADLGDGQRLTARVTAEQAMPGPAASVQVTVRPERITLHTEAPGALDPGDSLVRGVVSDLVYLGSLTQVSVELPGGELLVVRRMSDDASIRSVRPGDPVVATWAPEGAHVIGPTNPSSTP